MPSRRLLICEGYEGAMFPEITYVKQGKNVLFFKGRERVAEAAINESVGAGEMQIVESLDDLETVDVPVNPDDLSEGTRREVKNGVYVLEGPFQRSDEKNANGRSYPRKLWEKLIADPDSTVQKNVKERAMLGHLEHPKDGRTDLNKGALVVTNLGLRKDGVVWGETELLDTPEGKRLQEYTRKKIRWGVSSRGNGTVSGAGQVQEDYMLTAFDAVATPSVSGAFPKARLQDDDPKVESDELDESGEPKSAVVSESAMALIAEAEALVQSVSEGDQSVAASVRQISDLLGRSSDQARAGVLPGKEVSEVNKWLSGALMRIASGLPATTDRNPQNVSESDESVEARLNEAVESVRASYQQRVDSLVDELESAREQAEEVEELQSKLDAACERARVAESHLSNLQSQLDIANELIADRSSVRIGNPISEAVEAVIKDVPALERYRETLESASSATQVEDIAESLAARALEDERNENNTVSPTGTRRTLPPSGARLESDTRDLKPVTESTTAPSHGARVAGAALSQMSKK